jgi:hypothetical protein
MSVYPRETQERQKGLPQNLVLSSFVKPVEIFAISVTA